MHCPFFSTLFCSSPSLSVHSQFKMSATDHPPVAKKLKITSKPFRTNSAGYKFLIDEFKRFKLDSRAGINPEETDNKVIGTYFDRTIELQPYSRKQFLRTNFRSASNDFLVESIKGGFRRRATELNESKIGGTLVEWNFFNLFFTFLIHFSLLFLAKRKAVAPPPALPLEDRFTSPVSDEDFEDLGVADTFDTAADEEENEDFDDLDDLDEDLLLVPYNKTNNTKQELFPVSPREEIAFQAIAEEPCVYFESETDETEDELRELMNSSLKISGSASSSKRRPPTTSKNKALISKAAATRVIPKIDGNYYIDTFNLGSEEPLVYTWCDGEMNTMVGIELHLPSFSREGDFRFELSECDETHYLLMKSRVNKPLLDPRTFLALLPNQMDPVNALRKSSRDIHIKDMVTKYTGSPGDPKCKNGINKIKVIRLPFLVDDFFWPKCDSVQGTHVEFCQMDFAGGESLTKLDIVLVKKEKVVKEFKNTPMKGNPRASQLSVETCLMINIK